MKGTASNTHIDSIRQFVDTIQTLFQESQNELKSFLVSFSNEHDCQYIQTYCALIQEEMEFGNLVSELITKLIEGYDQQKEWHILMEEGMLDMMNGERKKKLKDLFYLHSFDEDLLNFLGVDKKTSDSCFLSGCAPFKKFCSDTCSSDNDCMMSSSSSSSSDSSDDSNSSRSSESNRFAPSKELYYLPSTKQLLKQFEEEERENDVNIITALTMLLVHAHVEIDNHLQNLNLLVEEDEESQDSESGSSVDSEDKDEMSISGSDYIGLEVFEKNIDGASYPTSISIPKTITAPVKRSLVMEFDDESLS
ncbi:predicted protein [Chaetoceros tenuissimus]|nr:predicted protein [Chaetoceros tenuissimus]